MGQRPALGIEQAHAILLVVVSGIVIHSGERFERKPLRALQQLKPAGQQFANEDLPGIGLQRRVEVSEPLVQPDGQFQTGVPHQQVNVLVDRDRASVGSDLAHDDVVPVVARKVISRGGFARLVGFKLFARAKGNDPHRQRRSLLSLRDLNEETSNLLEVLERALGGAFAGAREHLEVRGGDFDPLREPE